MCWNSSVLAERLPQNLPERHFMQEVNLWEEAWEPAALIHHSGPGQLWPVWNIQTQCGPGDMQPIAAQNVTLDSDDLTSFRSRLFQLLELCTQYYAYLENRNNCNTVISMAQYTRTSYLLGKTLQLPWPTNYATINGKSTVFGWPQSCSKYKRAKRMLVESLIINIVVLSCSSNRFSEMQRSVR